MSIKLRHALPEDSEALTDIARQAKAHWGYGRDLLELWSNDLAVSPSFIEDNYVLCACQQHEILGFAAFCEDRGVYELEHLWVRPDRIGQGVGAQLFDGIMRGAKARGARELRIVSDPNAEGFYLKRGATRVGEVASTPEGRRLPLLAMRVDAWVPST